MYEKKYLQKVPKQATYKNQTEENAGVVRQGGEEALQGSRYRFGIYTSESWLK